MTARDRAHAVPNLKRGSTRLFPSWTKPVWKDDCLALIERDRGTA
jgi:hypothetical protein